MDDTPSEADDTSSGGGCKSLLPKVVTEPTYIDISLREDQPTSSCYHGHGDSEQKSTAPSTGRWAGAANAPDGTGPGTQPKPRHKPKHVPGWNTPGQILDKTPHETPEKTEQETARKIQEEKMRFAQYLAEKANAQKEPKP